MMEGRMTAAGRVRRRLKAGKPGVPSSPLTALQALHMLVTEADKTRGLMREEGLNPDDAQLALTFKVERLDLVGTKPLPLPGKTTAFFEYFEAFGDDVRFLGVIWIVLDREAGRFLDWVKPLTADVEDLMLLTASRESVAKKSGRPQENKA